MPVSAYPGPDPGPHAGPPGSAGPYAGALTGPYADRRLIEDLVTGEAVVLDLRSASFASRALALVIDLVALAAVAALVIWLLVVALDTDVLDEAASGAVGLVAFLAVLLGVPITVETMTRGRSLGKWVTGLRVVRDDGGPIRARHALIRGLLAVVEIYWTLGSIALITSLVNRRGKRLGDLLAGTYVLRERAPRRQPSPLYPPSAQLRAWSRASDLAELPDRLSLAVRQFLIRGRRLNSASRTRIALALAAHVSGFVAPPPPAGTPPEEFLNAVLVERHDRDLARLTREAQAQAARQARRAAASPLSVVGSGLVESPPRD
jgi:uncharacterized RDD family membrane protein YckC